MVSNKTELIINIGDRPINCDLYEQETHEAINDLCKLTTEVAANKTINLLIELNKNGVLFQSKLVFNIPKRHYFRFASLDTLQTIPGFSEIYRYVNVHWPRLNHTSIGLKFFKLVMLNLFLCNNANNLLDIDQTSWNSIIDSWRAENKTFINILGTSTDRRTVLTKIAEAYSALKNDHAYKKILGRKPQRGRKGVLGGDYVVQNPMPETLRWTKLFVEWLNNQPLKTTGTQKYAFKYFLDWLANYPPHIFQNPVVFLSEQRRNPSICDFFGGKKTYEISIMFRFTEWVIDELMMKSSEDGVLKRGYSILNTRDVSFMKLNLPVRSTESSSNPLPTRWRLKVANILTDGRCQGSCRLCLDC